jgi:hypothetical protein
MTAAAALVPAPTLADTPLPAAPRPAYFERSGPPRLILSSFPLLTLPVAAMVLFAPDQGVLAWLYFWLLGGTHVVVTLTVYGSRANRRHFTASPKTLAVFVVAPLLVLAVYAALAWVSLSDGVVPAAAVWFWAGVRVMNFLHLTRQSFGVLQLFKARTGGRFPAWGRWCENTTGLAAVAALMVTHAGGGVCPLLGMPPLYAPTLPVGWVVPLWVASVGVAVGLFAAAAVGLVRTSTAHGRWEAVAYFVAQFVGTMAAAFYLPLYLAALAMHYVEYHILMVPRVAAQPLDPASRIDRGYGWLRRRPVLFVAVVLLLSLLVTQGMGSMDFLPPAEGGAGAVAWGVALSAFDALILIHYLLEMFIWRFSDAHFRRSVAGVYFTRKSG